MLSYLDTFGKPSRSECHFLSTQSEHEVEYVWTRLRKRYVSFRPCSSLDSMPSTSCHRDAIQIFPPSPYNTMGIPRTPYTYNHVPSPSPPPHSPLHIPIILPTLRSNTNLIPNQHLRAAPLPPPISRRTQHIPTRRIDMQRRYNACARWTGDNEEGDCGVFYAWFLF